MIIYQKDPASLKMILFLRDGSPLYVCVIPWSGYRKRQTDHDPRPSVLTAGSLDFSAHRCEIPLRKRKSESDFVIFRFSVGRFKNRRKVSCIDPDTVVGNHEFKPDLVLLMAGHCDSHPNTSAVSCVAECVLDHLYEHLLEAIPVRDHFTGHVAADAD